MAQRYANGWSQAAAGLTSLAHTQASAFRWGVVALLTAVWLGGGVWYWTAAGEDIAQAIYLTLSAVGMWDAYFGVAPASPGSEVDPVLQVIRFAAIATPAVGLLFAFSGQLGRSLARIFNAGAAQHVVIAGDIPAALSLALDCRKYKDSVILIAENLAEETALGLRRSGVIVLQGNATASFSASKRSTQHVLAAARAQHAAHVVAFHANDSENLQIEAAVRALVGNARRSRPLGVHVSTHSPQLLREARAMQSARTSKHSRKDKADRPSIDPKPFSLHEIAARNLIQGETLTMLEVTKALGLESVHAVFFGFDDAAQSIAERILSSIWSAKFKHPKLTVMTPDPKRAEALFHARHREAFAHPGLWAADIAFLDFDWDVRSIGPELLDAVESARGKPSVAFVSTGADPGNIHLGIALKRVCNQGGRWPIPVFMKETSQSEFSREYARGDETDEFDSYLQAFGSHQVIATRAKILDGSLDRGAAIAHEHYNKGLGKGDAVSMKELQAAMRDWEDVLETYRAANRAAADAALVKVWDAGWRIAVRGERGDTAPTVPAEMMEALARREHDRWIAERLMSGWRPTAPGEARNNDLMAHDKLAPWDALSAADKENDVVQVRAAMDVARMMHKEGFVRRG